MPAYPAAVRPPSGRGSKKEREGDGVLTCVFVGGHALLAGVPGIGKPLLVRTLARAVDLSFSRVQFTPDLMPADIVGTTVVVESEAGGGHPTREFRFQPGPVFAQ